MGPSPDSVVDLTLDEPEVAAPRGAAAAGGAPRPHQQQQLLREDSRGCILLDSSSADSESGPTTKLQPIASSPLRPSEPPSKRRRTDGQPSPWVRLAAGTPGAAAVHALATGAAVGTAGAAAAGWDGPSGGAEGAGGQGSGGSAGTRFRDVKEGDAAGAAGKDPSAQRDASGDAAGQRRPRQEAEPEASVTSGSPMGMPRGTPGTGGGARDAAHPAKRPRLAATPPDPARQQQGQSREESRHPQQRRHSAGLPSGLGGAGALPPLSSKPRQGAATLPPRQGLPSQACLATAALREGATVQAQPSILQLAQIAEGGEGQPPGNALHATERVRQALQQQQEAAAERHAREPASQVLRRQVQQQQAAERARQAHEEQALELQQQQRQEPSPAPARAQAQPRAQQRPSTSPGSSWVQRQPQQPGLRLPPRPTSAGRGPAEKRESTTSPAGLGGARLPSRSASGDPAASRAGTANASPAAQARAASAPWAAPRAQKGAAAVGAVPPCAHAGAAGVAPGAQPEQRKQHQEPAVAGAARPLPVEPPQWARRAQQGAGGSGAATAAVLAAARGVAPGLGHPLAAWTPGAAARASSSQPVPGWMAFALGVEQQQSERQQQVPGRPEGPTGGSGAPESVARLLRRGVAVARAGPPAAAAAAGGAASAEERHAANGLAGFDLPEVAARLLAATAPDGARFSLQQRALRWVRQRRSTLQRTAVPRLRVELEGAGPAAAGTAAADTHDAAPEGTTGSRSGRRTARRVGAAGAAGARRPSRLGQAGAGSSASGGAAGARPKAKARAKESPEKQQAAHGKQPKQRPLAALQRDAALSGSWEQFAAVAAALRRARGEA
eukprot:scaffold5.g797.t1